VTSQIGCLVHSFSPLWALSTVAPTPRRVLRDTAAPFCKTKCRSTFHSQSAHCVLPSFPCHVPGCFSVHGLDASPRGAASRRSGRCARERIPHPRRNEGRTPDRFRRTAARQYARIICTAHVVPAQTPQTGNHRRRLEAVHNHRQATLPLLLGVGATMVAWERDIDNLAANAILHRWQQRQT
jgi:hypothetical protein